jgi:hypothetical protein
MKNTEPLDITQLIPKHLMFTDNNSGENLIGDIASRLNQCGPISRRARELKITSGNCHHIAIAEHITGQEPALVLETYTVWMQTDWDEDNNGYSTTVRMAKGIITDPEKLFHSGFEVSSEEYAYEGAFVAAHLFHQIRCEMEHRRWPACKSYSIHRIHNLQPTEAYYWTGYEI